MNKILYILLAFIFMNCSSNNGTDIYQNNRDTTINIHNSIKEININDILISGINRLYIINRYLIIEDCRSSNNLIHIFNKNNFEYLASTAPIGQGPGEITNIGFIGTDEVKNMIYVSDHGKQRIFSYNLDSLLSDSSYMPNTKMIMNEKIFPSEYEYIKDSFCIGRIIEPTGNSGYKPFIGKWNMDTGEITPMKYEHNKISKKRITFAVSTKNNIYIECYTNYDLMSICDLDGNLKYNIYGPNWNNNNNKGKYYHRVVFCNDTIIASFFDNFSNNSNSLPSKFILFDLKGNYIKTIETNYHINDFCYDKENNRIVMSTEDEIQFAYFDLNKIR